MALHNRVDSRILKEQLKKSNEERTTISFYRYYHLTDPKTFRDNLYLKMDTLGVRGRIYVAPEGINAQISVPKD